MGAPTMGVVSRSIVLCLGIGLGAVCRLAVARDIQQHAQQSTKVAVLGGGMAGASAAYFIHKEDPKITIDVFEADQEGGRAREMVYKGQRLELGASIIWEFNNYLAHAAKDLKLSIRWLSPPTHPDNITAKAAAQAAQGSQLQDARKNEVFTIWDGKQFVMTSDDGWWNMIKMLFKYGLTPIVYGKQAQKAGERFKSIYAMQDRGEWFHTPEELLQQAGLYNYTQHRCREWMQAHLHRWWMWGRQAFIEQLAGAINRCNYNQQSSNMNAMAGLVSYLPATGGGVWQVVEGNSRLAAGMLSKAASVVSLGTRITRIAKQADGSFLLTSSTSDTQDQPEQHGPYDAVVLAFPLEMSAVEITGPEGVQEAGGHAGGGQEQQQVIRAGREVAGRAAGAKTCTAGEYGTHCAAIPPRKFQKTVTTYVDGALQPGAFGVSALPAQTIFVSEHADTDFSSISRTEYEGGSLSSVYKVFSSEPLPDARIHQLFGGDAKVVQVKEWWAYPQFAPPEQFAPFQLAPGVCYTSALENSASAMEVAAVAGRNCALMTLAQLKAARQASSTSTA